MNVVRVKQLIWRWRSTATTPRWAGKRCATLTSSHRGGLRLRYSGAMWRRPLRARYEDEALFSGDPACPQCHAA